MDSTPLTKFPAPASVDLFWLMSDAEVDDVAREPQMNAHEIADAKSWLDIEIHAPPDFGPVRWKWLGLVIAACATIPSVCNWTGLWEDIGPCAPGFLGGFIFVFWYHSHLLAKVGMAFAAGLLVLLHQTLPIPSIGYGCIHWYLYETAPVLLAQRWWLVALAFGVGPPILTVVGAHYCVVAIMFVDERLKAWVRRLRSSSAKSAGRRVNRPLYVSEVAPKPSVPSPVS